VERNKTSTSVFSRSAASMGKAAFKLGVYIRLSKEDINKTYGASDSVTNQKKLLEDYYKSHIAEFEYAAYYIDDGYTGTDTNREGFQRLLADIYSKKINCVIVKDLSRLSRNYADAGGIIENLFIGKNIRFISLAENIDSYINPESVSDIIVPITNVINDNFSYQTSKKIRQVFDYKRRSGEFIGSFAPYGYQKDPLNRNKLIIDPEAAEIVRSIFTWFAGGMGKSAIVRKLNDLGILCPTEYKYSKGLSYYNPHAKDKSFWSARTVTSILKNQMYAGDMVQGRQRVKSYKTHVLEQVDPGRWYIVQDTHEPVVDKDLFNEAQLLSSRRARIPYGESTPHIFSGILRCADCARAISRSKSKGHIYYFCRRYKDCGSSACTKHSIKHGTLENAVFRALKNLICLSVSPDDIMLHIEALKPEAKGYDIDRLIALKEKEILKLNRYKKLAFEDWKDDKITEEDYINLNQSYSFEMKNINKALENLNKEKEITSINSDTENPHINKLKTLINMTELSRTVIAELIDYIEIYEDGSISINFRFRNPFELLEV